MRIKKTYLIPYEEPKEILFLMVKSKEFPQRSTGSRMEVLVKEEEKKKRSMRCRLCLPTKTDTINWKGIRMSKNIQKCGQNQDQHQWFSIHRSNQLQILLGKKIFWNTAIKIYGISRNKSNVQEMYKYE